MDVEAKIDLRSLDLAHSLALTELIRFALIEIASNDDRGAFRNRLRKIEEGIVTSLTSRRHFPAIGDQEEGIIREAACGFVSRLIASIRRPGDAKP
jgi:hypothetical protein